MVQKTSPIGDAWRLHVEGHDSAAVERFVQLSDASPEDIDTLYGLGLAQRGAGRYEDALATFNKVLELLTGVQAESEDEQNRLEMLMRMSRQQIEFIERARKS